MIDLFSVKLNGEYDDIGAVPSIQNGLFLCDTTGETYTKGYSYEITDGNAERIDSVKDYKIKQAIYPTIQSVCEWLNNWFTIPCKNSCFTQPFGYMTDENVETNDLLKATNKKGVFS